MDINLKKNNIETLDSFFNPLYLTDIEYSYYTSDSSYKFNSAY